MKCVVVSRQLSSHGVWWLGVHLKQQDSLINCQEEHERKKYETKLVLFQGVSHVLFTISFTTPILPSLFNFYFSFHFFLVHNSFNASFFFTLLSFPVRLYILIAFAIFNILFSFTHIPHSHLSLENKSPRQQNVLSSCLAVAQTDMINLVQRERFSCVQNVCVCTGYILFIPFQ